MRSQVGKAMPEPRRYTITLDVEVSDQDDHPDRLERERVTARCLQWSRQVRGGSDAEALCNLFRYGLREGWMTEKAIIHLIGASMRTQKKARP
jgi:hypothetical protein